MFVLAGLSPATHTHAVAYLKNRFPAAAVIGLPSGKSDDSLYPTQLICSLIRAVTEFATRRRKSSEPPKIAPKYIILMYVPSDDQERLLKAFDFAIMPEPLPSLCARDARGTQMRHSEEAVVSALSAAVSASGRAKSAIDKVVERLNRLADSDALLLPPKNFHTETGLLWETFEGFRNLLRKWEDRINEIKISELTNDDIARIPHQKTRRVLVDRREIAFLMAHPKAFHAPPREVEAFEDTQSQMQALRSLYRFGGPLEAGLHHDAIYSDGSAFKNCEMLCDADGRVNVSGDYANIYPNDYVRAETKRKI